MSAHHFYHYHIIHQVADDVMHLEGTIATHGYINTPEMYSTVREFIARDAGLSGAFTICNLSWLGPAPSPA